MSVAQVVEQEAVLTKNALGGHTLGDSWGFPIQYFAGAWYFTHNSAGVGYNDAASAPGPFLDITGNGKHAAILLGSTPVKESWGIQIADVDGIMLDPGIDFPASGTFIIATTSTVSSAVSHHQTLFKPAHQVPATKAGNFESWAAPHPSMTTTAAVAYANTHGILDYDGALGRLSIPAWRSMATEHNVVAFRWNNTTGRVELMTIDGYVFYEHADLIGFFSAWTSVHALFGLIPTSLIRPCTGNVYAAALATTVLENSVIWDAMHAIARMKYYTGSGLVISGYTPPTI